MTTATANTAPQDHSAALSHLPHATDTCNLLIEDSAEIVRIVQEGVPAAHQRPDFPADIAVCDIPQGQPLKFTVRQRLDFMGAAENFTVTPSCPGPVSTFKLLRVYEREDGLGEITAKASDLTLTFLDPYYLRNRLWYRAGKKYRFALSAVAALCRTGDFEKASLDGMPIFSSVDEALVPQSPLEALGAEGPSLKPLVFETCYAFKGKILNVATDDFYGHQIRRVLIESESAPRQPLYFMACASDAALGGCELQKDDEARGVAFFFGQLMTRPLPKDGDKVEAPFTRVLL